MSKIFDSEYSIQKQILSELGGDGTKCFDSQYSILLEILDKIQGGSGAQIDDDHISTETTWSSSKIVSELADAGFNVLVVQELPTTGEAHTLYFVPSSDPQTQNAYDEYLYVNNGWELVGSTAVDMSDYYTADEVDALLEDYATITYVDASLANKANISYVDTNFAKLSVLTQAQYDALVTKDASTLYIISDAQ